MKILNANTMVLSNGLSIAPCVVSVVIRVIIILLLVVVLFNCCIKLDRMVVGQSNCEENHKIIIISANNLVTQ